jgi:pimeloyl-ACP methyl ester carboxylesterase
MVEGLQPSGEDNAKVLAIVLHGWGGSPASMKDVIETTKSTLKDLGVDVYAPRLPYSFRLKSVRAEKVVVDLLNEIDRIVEKRGPYRQIIIIGHSLGALIARRLFLVAAGKPPGFQSEMPFAEEEKPRAWAKLVDRLVTLGAFNRGWEVSGRMDWYSSFLLNLVGLIGHLSPNDWRPTIFDMRRGAPFIVQTRLHWLAYRRLHQQIREGQIEKNKLTNLQVAPVDPIVVQLIGTKDNLASPFDQVDIAVDGRDPLSTPQDRRYFFVEMKNTDHEHAMDFSDETDGKVRKERFMAALTGSTHELHLVSSNPSLLPDDIPLIEPDVTDTVFIMHGIRDDGFWTHRIAKEVREHAERGAGIRARTPTYGYFAMLPFILPWIRRQKVEWLMDQYVSVKAQFSKR